MKCRVHPGYRAVLRPRANCEQCRMMWELKVMREALEQIAAVRPKSNDFANLAREALREVDNI